MKNNPVATANSLALTVGIIYIVCRLLVGLFPGLMYAIAQSWFHDIKLTQLDGGSLSISTFFLGLVSSMISAWIAGYMYSYIRKFMKSS
ncbi:hypothetical protein HY947_06460 [Candidatus Gottesmanbacteria bacterium]|nr:hypothetical protein [Candidatus Gottesmanbacteria bacterium]